MPKKSRLYWQADLQSRVGRISIMTYVSTIQRPKCGISDVGGGGGVHFSLNRSMAGGSLQQCNVHHVH